VAPASPTRLSTRSSWMRRRGDHTAAGPVEVEEQPTRSPRHRRWARSRRRWVRVREQLERWVRGVAGSVDGPGAEGVGDADDGDVLAGAHDERLVQEVGHAHARAVDAQVGDGRRVGEPEGHAQDLARARGRLGARPVLVIGDVGCRVEDDPAGGRPGAPPGGVGGRGLL
jgi:hypothetical protein